MKAMSARGTLILMTLSTAAVIQVHAMLTAGLPPLPLHRLLPHLHLRADVIPVSGMSDVQILPVRPVPASAQPKLINVIITANGNIGDLNAIPPDVAQTVETILHLHHHPLLRLRLNRVVAPLFL
ncbi:hypothetical protein A3D02_04155 [Candidatus Daviesbacteria bacterium RIFCSPHIGHO2_02_FULL_39_41]|nr:MAG: hypothetical protein A3D02_04155 [Candidatus Daviesbacteria bacterium RIFCSPHIGHO2_02_FULL_39_41]